MAERLLNYINGSWQPSAAGEVLKVLNPASAAVLAEVPLSPAAEVDRAVERRAQGVPRLGGAPQPESAFSRCSG